MRTGRGDAETVYGESETFEIHKAKMVRDGNDVTIIACGEMVFAAKQAAELLAAQGVSARAIDMFCLKPADTDVIIRAARETTAIVTVEEHSIHGGLGELICAVTAQYCPIPVKVMGFPDEEYKIGTSAELFKHYGLTAGNVAAQAVALIGGAL